MAGNFLPPGDPPGALVQPPAFTPAPALDYDLTPFQPPAEGGGIPWRRYISALRRYKWLMLLVIIVGTGATVLATRFMKPQYTVQATIWIESPSGHGGPVRAGSVVEGYNWVELLTTFTVLDSVVARERLYLTFTDPKDSVLFTNFRLRERFRPGEYVLQTDRAGRSFSLRSAEGLAVQQGKVGDAVGTRIGFDWTPPTDRLARTKGRKVSFKVTSPRDASLALKDQLTTLMKEQGNFIRLMLVGTNPVRITSTMN
ncbi:MAG TPA: Wzz/FepE/Etk N-terminal domain-containing protein, partial [Gemmatimonadales bacterium]|nr:Wzz/FepE/Etk N-terminal domain-containing protein [Gemmatimonadales bacterium]